MKTMALIIPAHNESARINKTLHAYHSFYTQQHDVTVSMIVVLNGCTDATELMVEQCIKELSHLSMVVLPQAGKGLAIKAGFEKALTMEVDYIGFVDADMATTPASFLQLIQHSDDCNGVIASRYMKGGKTIPERPLIKRWGSRLIYEPLIWWLLGIRFSDYQCGAKLFKREVIATIVSFLKVTQWAFDVELLYLCKQFDFRIKEIPTIWYDQTDSKLKIRAGFAMLSALFRIKFRHRLLPRETTVKE